MNTPAAHAPEATSTGNPKLGSEANRARWALGESHAEASPGESGSNTHLKQRPALRQASFRGTGLEPATALLQATHAQRQCAMLLAAKRDYASRSTASAMAWGNWSVAARWEEQRVTSEHELALLQLERCFGPRPNHDC
jgi:hypothetical protein